MVGPDVGRARRAGPSCERRLLRPAARAAWAGRPAACVRTCARRLPARPGQRGLQARIRRGVLAGAAGEVLMRAGRLDSLRCRAGPEHAGRDEEGADAVAGAAPAPALGRVPRGRWSGARREAPCRARLRKP